MTVLAERQLCLDLLQEAVSAGARQTLACAILGFAARTIQRWTESDTVLIDQRPLQKTVPAHKLTLAERATVLAVANSAEFAHLPPSQIVPRLADQQRYIASESTFYRVLRAADQLQHRRAERPAQVRSKPKALSAITPNQLYSWDITYLASTIQGKYFYLYIFLDVFSRKIIGWQVYAEESSQNASDMIQDICLRERVTREQVVLHSDNGSSMKGSTMLATLQNLGVAPSFSRPAVSNDNPYSESLFKTLKYRPMQLPKPFEDLLAARQWATQVVHWYNEEHRHSSIKYVTPTERHAGEDQALLAQRIAVYEAARAENPQRWSGKTRNWERTKIVHLNPEKRPDTEALLVREKVAQKMA
jgi:transposase InsO family protein